MKIAIDTGPLGSGDKVRGVGFYTKHLIEALKRLKKEKGKEQIEIYPVDVSEVDHSNYDIVHYPYFKPYFTEIPNDLYSKVAVTLHDVIPLLYPKHYPPGIKGKLKLMKQRRDLHNVDAIITDTEASKKDIVRFLGVEQEKIFSIHLAPARHFQPLKNRKKLDAVKRKFNLPKNFVLYVGDVNYNKNIPTLVKACKQAKTPLVIAGKQAKEIGTFDLDIANLRGPRDWVRYLFGKPHPETAHYNELLKLFKNNKNILRLGFVSDEDLVAVYNLATLYCQPSLAEGFGLPVLEAMACRIPVIASRTQALVEIAEGAAVFFDPEDKNDLADKIRLVTKDASKLSTLIDKSDSLVARYSWNRTAKETAEIYRKTINGQE